MQVELQVLESLICIKECINEDAKEKEKKQKKKGHFAYVCLDGNLMQINTCLVCAIKG